MGTTTRRPTDRIAPRIKVWIEIDGSYVFGRGISDILKAIDEAGSIKEAAKTVGKSYRYVWSRVKEAELALGTSLVQTKVGGNDVQRSQLTDVARILVSEFDRLRLTMGKVLIRKFPRRLRTLLKTE